MNIEDEYIIYLILNNKNALTYVGITNNPERRIRQHNGEIKGGAKYTSLKKGNGSTQRTACFFRKSLLYFELQGIIDVL